MHVADVHEVGPAQPLQPVGRRLVEQPPPAGEGGARQPGVKHHPLGSQLEVHAGVRQVSHLGERVRWRRPASHKGAGGPGLVRGRILWQDSAPARAWDSGASLT